MKILTVFTALAAVVTAQTSTFAFDITESFNLQPTEAPTPTSIQNIELEPSTITQISGPVETIKACGQIADAVSGSTADLPAVDAELAIACLKSLPFLQRDASATVDQIKNILQFQSTLAYLKDPPQGYPNPPVDLVAGLDNIKNNVESGQYDNEFDFEADIAALMVKAHDGHLAWNGMAYAGALAWRRSSNIALISTSTNGSETPQIWARQDFRNSNNGYEPSPITQINGKDVFEFLNEEADLLSYQDPDTRYNAMLFMPAAESYGAFINPHFFPGVSTNVTYQNGTTDEYRNAAIVIKPSMWRRVKDANSFYEVFCVPDGSILGGVKKRDMSDPPLQLKNSRDRDFKSATTQQHASVPLYYPEPVIAHSADAVPLAGYFINTGVGQVGVLIVQTFLTKDVQGAQEFQRVIQEYISQAKSRGVEKHIIDVRGNPGGKILSGYDMFLQFFPSQVPQTQSRYRGHRASELLGQSISSYEELTLGNGQFFTSPFSNDAYLSANLTEFPDWKAMYPPTQFKGDNFTALLKYNLSDPLTTSNPRLAVGITMTGYGSRSNFTDDPFRAEDLVILSDGVCSSTCTIFLELMVQQSGVRTIAVGGRPQLGPMVSVGGTKGTLILPSVYMEVLSLYIALEFADTRSEVAEWATFLPTTAPIAVLDAAVNLQDNIRAGMEDEGVPTQFLNDTASCRMWYETRDYFNVTGLREKTAMVAFGNEGRLDERRCVAGSVTSKEQQTGKGDGNSSGGGGGGKSGGDEDAASGLRVAWTTTVVCAGAVALSLLLV